MNGYHVTYLDRWTSIKKEGLRGDMAPRFRTGLYLSNGLIYFISNPRMAKWCANGRNLNSDKDWVLLKVIGLERKLLRADDDYEENPMKYKSSIERAGTFAYAGSVLPSQISIYRWAVGTKRIRHDEFESLL